MKIRTVFFITLFVACSLAATAEAKPVTKFKTSPAASTEIKPTSAIASTDEDDMTPDVSASKTLEYKCELNGSLTIYTNADDDNHAAIRWKNHLYRLKRIETTTGADRFENKKVGLVWIGIPTKGMLMDSLHGEQLANECITQEQQSVSSK